MNQHKQAIVLLLPGYKEGQEYNVVYFFSTYIAIRWHTIQMHATTCILYIESTSCNNVTFEYTQVLTEKT